MVFPAFDVAEHRSDDIHRREFAPAVALDQRRRRKLMQRAPAGHAPLVPQDSAARSFTKIGMSFHKPFTSFFATVGNCGWNRKPLAASAASSFCASPSSLARSFGLPVVLILSYTSLKALDW